MFIQFQYQFSNAYFIIFKSYCFMQPRKELLICQKHKKYEKNLAVIPNNYYICLNRYCPSSFTVICANCKQDHRDHIVKLLSIEDICFLVDRLLKTPFKQATNYMIQTIDVMRKLQLIRQFKKKIDKLQSQIQRETFNLVDMTETLIGEYAQCKKAANDTADLLFDIENYETAKEILEQQKIQPLARIDYNFQKDKFEFGGVEVKEKEEMRRKIGHTLKRKIQEVKEYSMKIIEVILNSEESDEEEEDIMLKKKIYENLKAELYTIQKENKDKQSQHASTKGNTELSECSFREMGTKEVQTEENFDKKIKELEQKLVKCEEKCLKLERQMITETKNAIKFKETSENKIKEKEKQIQQFQKKIELLTHFEQKLRENLTTRRQKQHDRARVIHNVIELAEYQNTKAQRRSVSKQSNTRDKSKSPKKNEMTLNLKLRK